MPTKTRSPRRRAEPTADELRRLKISPEVGHYLISRGIPLPTCPPKVKTPEPGELLKSARFDPGRVDRVLRAFGMLRHTKGKWAGLPLKPDPWQIAYVIAPVFGWVHRVQGRWVRVIREAYVDVPRKNGKSTLAGGIALYLTAADGENGAEVYAAATTEKQAGYVFAPVKSLVQKSVALAPYVKAYARKIVHPASGSYFEVISSLAAGVHGGSVHGAIIDELHLHKSPDLVEALETGTGSRDQPLIVIITTADEGEQGTIYARKRRRVEQLSKRVFRAPSTYGVIWAAEESDDPFAAETQRAANPGYGISPTKQYLEKAAREARQSPVDLAKYLRLHLGVRTRLEKRYLDLAAWDRNAGMVDETKLTGRACWGGLDLASSSDLCALTWDFPGEDGSHDAVWRFWLPERAFDELVTRTAGEARVWRDHGYLTVTPGDVTDYEWIKTQVAQDRDAFDVQELAYDRWNASQLVNDLVAEEAPMVAMGQGFASMSAPMKQLKHLLLEGTARKPRYRHGGNPVVRWMVDNLRAAADAADNVKPDKKTSMDKIDGISSAVMALSGAMTVPEPEVRSAYEDHGLEYA